MSCVPVASGKHCRTSALAAPVQSTSAFFSGREPVFFRRWRAGLAEYEQMAGIAWRGQSIDGAMMKAPRAKQTVGPNPTDRGKKW
jgi:hypothetical protein